MDLAVRCSRKAVKLNHSLTHLHIASSLHYWEQVSLEATVEMILDLLAGGCKNTLLLGMFFVTYHQTSNIRQLVMQLTCWSLRCSWSIACWRCSNYIFILNLRPGFNRLHKDNWKMRWETRSFGIWCTLYKRIYGIFELYVPVFWIILMTCIECIPSSINSTLSIIPIKSRVIYSPCCNGLSLLCLVIYLCAMELGQNWFWYKLWIMLSIWSNGIQINIDWLATVGLLLETMTWCGSSLKIGFTWSEIWF